MKNTYTVAAILLVVFGSQWSDNLQARSPETEAKVKAALVNFKAVTAQSLRDPTNADLLAELRLIAMQTDETPAHVLLIRFGDEEAIRGCVNRLHSGRNRMAMRQLAMAGNPKVISFLEEEFNREESAAGTFVGSQLKFPVSWNAAWTVKEIILKSDAFSSSVEEWAKSLSEFSPGLRESVRAWWLLNQAALLGENYAAVIAP